MAKMTEKTFEKSGRDNDKGVKEGSKADKTRDAKEMKGFKKGGPVKGKGK